MDENDLQALLRLKRYEQPPAGYHQKFLQDFHRRQREELLRRPLWKIVLDRAQNFFGEHRPAQYAYATAGAFAVILAAALALDLGGSDSATALANQNSAPAALEVVSRRSPFAEEVQPRYVIDARPVSYEAPSSF